MADQPPTTLEQARAAKERAVTELADLPVVGIGITRVGDGYALKVNLDSAPSGAVPSAVNGVPIKVEVVGKIRKR
ncbi:MAG TPA: hypothetical protein VHR66_21755 [Gemmataceae bacterium]|nr:hypothetical protein [Gemmataceae bacterium]